MLESLEHVDRLPLELQEWLFIKSFVKLFVDAQKSAEAVGEAYSTLAGVCYSWRQTLNGWPQSATRHWFKNKLRRCLQCTIMFLSYHS